MKRIKLKFLHVLALGALIGLPILAVGSRSAVQAKDEVPTANSGSSGATDKPAERAAIGKQMRGFVQAFSSGNVDHSQPIWR